MLGCGLGACVADLPEGGDEPADEIEAHSAAIVNEQLGGIAERAFFRYAQDPSATLRSYAMVTAISNSSSAWPGTTCSGTMVGPNAMLTAGHCHGDQKTITFRAYVSASQQRTETYQCDYLIQTWPENDFALHWCYPDANGRNPGDRWGYVDYDIDISAAGKMMYSQSRNRLSTGTSVYSVWGNNITSISNDWQHIYSQGTITNANVDAWYNPGGDPCSAADDLDLGVTTNAWGRSGASGSSQLSTATHRLLLSPLSSAPSTPDGGPSRSSSAIADILKYGMLTDPRINLTPETAGCGGRLEPQVNYAALSTLWDQGIRFSTGSLADYTRYIDLLDKNEDGILDLQHDLEASAGEAARDFYALGFESQRQNALWNRHENALIYMAPQYGYSRADSSSNPANVWHRHLSHDSLHLDSSARYRIQYRVSSTKQADVAVCASGCAIHTLAAGQSKTFVDELGGASSFSLWVRGSTVATFRDLSIVKVSALMTFDSNDERKLWHTPQPLWGYAPAMIWPNGPNAGAGPDWAGIVRRPQTSEPEHYSLATSRLAIPKGRVQICFDHARPAGSAGSGNAVVRLRGVNGSELRFAPQSGWWQRICTGWVEATTSQNVLEFGASGDFGYTYAVDNVAIEVAPSDVPEGAVALVGLAGKCMEVAGGGAVSGTPVRLATCNGSAAQRFTFTAQTEIKGPGGLCLDVPGGRAVNRNEMQMYSCNGTASQHFTFTAQRELRSALNNAMCVEVKGGFTSDGTPIQLYDCNGTASQFWTKS